MAQNPGRFEAREGLKPGREEAYKVCKQRCLEFGCEGHAAKFEPMALSEVAAACCSGQPEQTLV